jgi:hypothetical protein
VDGCEIVTLTELAMKMLDEGYKAKDIPESEILLSISLKSNEQGLDLPGPMVV